jgi:mannosyl-oligosaccharide glucosidase
MPWLWLLWITAVLSDNGSIPVWGTWSPNLYFGIKQRVPNGMRLGLAWHRLSDDLVQPLTSIRHACDQGDQLPFYSYTRHNGRSFAHQLLKDSYQEVGVDSELNLETSFLDSSEQGFSVRIKGTSSGTGINLLLKR